MNAQVMLGRLTQVEEILLMIPVARVVMEVLNIVTPIADGTTYLPRASSTLHENQIIPSINTLNIYSDMIMMILQIL